MNTKGALKLLLGTALASAVGVSSAFAQSDPAGDISFVENNIASGTTAVTLNSDPVITAVLSEPGTVDGNNYSNWSFLVNDGSGSMDIFGAMPGGFTPTVGETISVTGEYSPFHQIPELEALTAISQVATASVPAVQTTTIPQLNVDTLPYSVAGFEWTLDNVTITGTQFGSTANESATITDGDGNSMTLFYWETSYSMALQNLDGFTPVPGQEYDITGFDSVFSNTTPEFSPISIVAVPEPGTLSLCGAGGLMLIRLLRRRSA